MAKLTNEEIIEALKEMTLLEASELVKMIEDTFGVSAAAPAAVVAAGPAAGAAEEEEKTEFDVVLEGFGDNKIQVIKEGRSRGCQEGGRRRCQGEARGCRRCRLHQVTPGRSGTCSWPHSIATALKGVEGIGPRPLFNAHLGTGSFCACAPPRG